MNSGAPPPGGRGRSPGRDDHWLARPETIRRLWIAFLLVLAATLVPDFFLHEHEVFGVEGSFAFDAWFGFGSCVAMVVFARVVGIFLKREDTYYGD